MPSYQYLGAYRSGEKVSGVVEALSEAEAVQQIRRTCDVVLSLKEVPSAGGQRVAQLSLKRVKPKNLALVSRQFAIILGAGLPIVQTVKLVAEQAADKTLSKMLKQVAEDVAGGWSVSYSLEQRGKSLPVTFRETIRAGEESGDLAGAFQRMSEYYERTSKTRAKAISAMTYPAFVMVVAVIVIAIIMGYAIPAFTSTFESLGAELPGITKALISFSNFFSQNILIIVAVLVLIIVGFALAFRTEKGGRFLSRLRLSLPILGEIGRMAGASQFAHTMSALLAAGVPILQAIEASGRAMSSRIMSEEVLSSVAGVESGRSLGECLAATRELPPMLIQMTAVGEQSGSMESTLEVLARFYDNEVETRTDRALSLLEPAIIICLAVFVVFVLLAVYLPMFSMYGSIG